MEQPIGLWVPRGTKENEICPRGFGQTRQHIRSAEGATSRWPDEEMAWQEVATRARRRGLNRPQVGSSQQPRVFRDSKEDEVNNLQDQEMTAGSQEPEFDRGCEDGYYTEEELGEFDLNDLKQLCSMNEIIVPGVRPRKRTYIEAVLEYQVDLASGLAGGGQQSPRTGEMTKDVDLQPIPRRALLTESWDAAKAAFETFQEAVHIAAHGEDPVDPGPQSRAAALAALFAYQIAVDPDDRRDPRAPGCFYEVAEDLMTDLCLLAEGFTSDSVWKNDPGSLIRMAYFLYAKESPKIRPELLLEADSYNEWLAGR